MADVVAAFLSALHLFVGEQLWLCRQKFVTAGQCVYMCCEHAASSTKKENARKKRQTSTGPVVSSQHITRLKTK